MWPFVSKTKQAKLEKERIHAEKLEASQHALITAATSTADAAYLVTTKLKQHLEDSILQFETTAALIADALIICNEFGQIKAVNPSAEKIFDFTSTQFVTTNLTSLFLLENTHPELPTLLEIMSNKNTTPLLKGRNSSGQTFPIDVTMTKLTMSDHRVLYLMLVRNISSQLQYQKLSEIKDRHFKSVFELSFDAILIVQDQFIVAANPAARRIFGINVSDLTKTKLDTLANTEEDKIRINALDDVAAHEPIKIRSKKSDGTNTKLFFSSGAITWNDAPAHLVTVKDIGAYGDCPDKIQMICITDANHIITFVNDSYMKYYNKTKEELVGSDIRTHMCSDGERDAYMMNISGLSEDHHTRKTQWQNTTAENTITLVEWTDHVSYNSGVISEYQRVGKDITDKIQKLIS